MRRFFRGWRPMLRIARRDALRARGRSVLVLAMIALPVLAVVALDTLARTSEVTVRESLDRKVGSADAMIMFEGDRAPVDQNSDLSYLSSQSTGTELPLPTERTVTTALGAGSRVIALNGGQVGLLTSTGVSRPGALEVDLRDPMTTGLFDLREGRMPRSVDEIAVSVRLSERGFAVGDTVRLESGLTRRVAAIVESTSTLEQNRVIGLPGSLGIESTDTHRVWLAHRPGGVDWPTVRDLNTEGLYVLSRDVVENPPPPSQVTAESFDGGGMGSTEIAVLALVVAMVLLEVVLLAGPAFAVGARRQQRSLALILATGGQRRDVKRAVLAGGVVLGSVATVIGVVGGVAVAWLARPFVQRFSSEVLGPFEVSVRDVAAIASCGLLSAVLAALAPALLAARQDVVAVLAGRRGETRTRLRSPSIGAVLLVVGVALAGYGARKDEGGELVIAFSAITAVVGMVLIIPLVVAHLGRVARWLPLPARFAVRDAARHRSRTSPAVAAVAATVAGVVALGIGGASDAAESRATYTLNGPVGAAVVRDSTATPEDWVTIREAISAQMPGARISPVHGLPDPYANGEPDGPVETLEVQLARRSPNGFSDGYTSNFGAGVLVGAASLLSMGLEGLTDDERLRAVQTLSSGGVVVFAAFDDGAVEAIVSKVTGEDLETQQGPSEQWTVPAAVVTVPGTIMPAQAVVSEHLVDRADLAAVTTALVVDGTPIGTATEDALSETIAAISGEAFVSVERGYQDNSTTIILLLLGCVGGVLVLGGTLTATLLALSDARPDFATMGAVGAAPRTRRFVAAAYAGTIGLIGAVLGAVVGFVPGIAVTYPLTGIGWRPEGSTDAEGVPLPDHFLEVPWLLIGGLVVLLPLLTALVVGLASRSRLPMVSRVS